MIEKPESLSVVPNIPLREQTDAQLRDELAYWRELVRTSPGFASAAAAYEFVRGCESELGRRSEKPAND